MRKTISIGAGLGLALAAFAVAAAAKGPGKAPPACSAINFHSLATGMTDGDHQAGMYRSRYGRLELHGEVKQGAAVDYYVSADGKRAAAASGNLPEAAVSCAAAKKMPKPEAPASSCTGQRFRVVVAHAGEQRLAMLYGEDGGSWHSAPPGPFSVAWPHPAGVEIRTSLSRPSRRAFSRYFGAGTAKLMRLTLTCYSSGSNQVL